MDFTVEQKDEGRLVRDFLRSVGVSATLAAKLKQKERGIVLNGRRVTVRARLQTGDVLSLDIEDAEIGEKLPPLAVLPDFLRKTPDYMVINKPPFMPTHPSHGHYTDTLANALVYALQGEEYAFRPRFINRLDRNTSGIVLAARHALAAAALSRDMKEGKFRKGYLALVRGCVDAPDVIETGIRRREASVIERVTCPVGEGDRAVTVLTPLLWSDALSLVKLEPQTGRTHQLRVHMAHLGHAILGDDLYGEANRLIGRHALHAAFLAFPDPATGASVAAYAPLPQDMRAIISEYFGEEGCRVAETAFS
jgi:23S rRNA pseudouridine1911/1915/1917 synthase